MISNKLVSTVLGINCTTNKVVGNVLIYNKHYTRNLYEFMNLCKKWAYTKNYHLDAIYCLDEQTWSCYCVNTIHDGYDYSVDYLLIEPEAVFACCEWIL